MKIGIVGWRGMVGSVLVQRMHAEGDLEGHNVSFFSTSQAGKRVDISGYGSHVLQDAYDLEVLASHEMIITAQGGDYTGKVFDALRSSGWSGFWVDAASALRMREDCCLVLDPVNRDGITESLMTGVNTFAGANCTVSLLLMAIGPLFREGLVESVTSMTYQAASGAGAKQMKELLAQSVDILGGLDLDQMSPLELSVAVQSHLVKPSLPTAAIGAPLAFNVLPYIDSPIGGGDGRTKEEWKGSVELNKIISGDQPISADGLCVRVPVLRCHSQAFMLKLSSEIEIPELTRLIEAGHEWIEVIPNDKAASIERLAPAAVSGTLKIAVGRLRHMVHGSRFVAGFTVGDQLLWGAAEPLRRMIRILSDFKKDQKHS